MKQLTLKQLTGSSPMEDYSMLELQNIDSDCWNYGTDVKASFGIAYDPQNIYLRFNVQESNTKAVYRNFNDPVNDDSCVEFFVSFEKGYYYNLEFNCIGTILGAYGSGREDRVLLDSDLLASIQTVPSLGTGKILIEDRDTRWTLDVKIPLSIFKFSGMDTFKNKTAFCNFYKCGDKQVIEHYLSWLPIKAEKPDFHRPEYFGELNFE